MKKIIRSKRGINDISILAIIFSIFLLTAILVPFINSSFGSNIDSFDVDSFETGIKQEVSNVNVITAFSVLVNVLKLALFDWDGTLGIPFFLSIVYTLLAILFILIIARNIWVGGGA